MQWWSVVHLIISASHVTTPLAPPNNHTLDVKKYFPYVFPSHSLGTEYCFQFFIFLLFLLPFECFLLLEVTINKLMNRVTAFVVILNAPQQNKDLNRRKKIIELN